MSSISPTDLLELFHSNEEDIVDVLSTTDLQSLSKDLLENVVITKEANKVFEFLDHDKLKSTTRARYLLSLVVGSLQQGRDTFTRFIKVLSATSGACKNLATKLNKQISPSRTSESLLHETDLEFLLEFLISCSYCWEELGVMLKLPKHVIEECRNKNTYKLKLKQVLDEWLTGDYKDAKEATLESLKAVLDSKTVACKDLALSLKEKYEGNLLSRSESTEALADADTGSLVIYQSSDTEVADHKSALLEVQVKKTSEPVSYQWMRDGQPLTDSSHFSGTTTAMLLINQATLGAEGEYSCQVSCGQKQIVTTSPIELQVQYPKHKEILISCYYNKDVICPRYWPLSTCNKFVDLTLVKINKLKKPSSLVIEKEIEAVLVEQKKTDYDSAFGEYMSGALILVEGRPGSGKTTLANKIVKDWSQGKALRNADKVFLIPLRQNLTKNQIFDLSYYSEAKKYIKDIEETGGEKACFVLDGYDEYHPKNKTNSVIHKLINREYLPNAMVIITSRPEGTADLRQKARTTIEILGFTREQLDDYIDYYQSEKYGDPNEEEKMRLQNYVKSCMNVLNICYLPINASIICFLFSLHLGDEPPPKTESQIYEYLILAISLRQMRVKNSSAKLCSLKDFSGPNETIFSQICSLAFHMTLNNIQIVPKTQEFSPGFLTSLKQSPFRGLFVLDHTMKLLKIENSFSFIHLTLQEYLAAYHLAKLDRKSQSLALLRATHFHMNTTIKFYCGLIEPKAKREQLPDLFLLINLSGNVLYMIHCAYESQEPEICRTALNTLSGEIQIASTTLTPADFTALNYVISAAPFKVTRLSFVGCNLYEDCFSSLFIDQSQNVKKLLESGTESLVTGYADIHSLLEITPLMIVSYKINPLITTIQRIIAEKEEFAINYSTTKTVYMAAAANRKATSDSSAGTALEHLNQMSTWTNSLLKCTKLKSLELTNFNSLVNASIFATYKTCCYVANLNELSISHITSTNMVIFGEMLKNCKNLQKFRLADSICSPEGSKALSEGLQHCKSLQNLTIFCTRLGPEGAIVLAQGLKCLPLKEVAFVGCDIKHDGIVALATEGCFNHVTDLCLNHDYVKSETVLPLIQGMSTDISTLVLKGNQIDSTNIAKLIEKLNSCPTFESLDICYNPIGPEGAAALGNGLKNCTEFDELDIAGCKITSRGIPALVNGFINWRKLFHLNLTDNQLCSNAMLPLSEHLQYLISLEYLLLSHNNIDDRGAIVLADGIKNCPSLCVFNISHNNIGSIGAAAIANALICQNIDFVNFSNNSINLENELLLIDLVNLAKRGNLKLLDLSHNKVGTDNTLRLIKGLINNLKVLNITSNDMAPEIIEFVTTFKKESRNPKIYINN